MKPITHAFLTDASAEAAYNAIATAAGIRGWWAKVGTIAEPVGGTTELHFDKGGRKAVMTFRIDALEPNRRVHWTCTANDNPAWPGSTLTWTIDDAGARRHVRFVHDGFASGGPAYDMTVEGWKHFNASLESYLDGTGGTPSD